MSDLNPLQRRAVAKYRWQHPEDDDLPDEVLVRLLTVQSLALRLTFGDLGRALLEAIEKDWPWLLLIWLTVAALALIASVIW